MTREQSRLMSSRSGKIAGEEEQHSDPDEHDHEQAGWTVLVGSNRRRTTRHNSRQSGVEQRLASVIHDNIHSPT